ncbi:MAG: class I SAM-dependent methyltransferase [Mycolicibacterium sp.]|uniref:class I SAM-dependent methyltransferase n=1 Tax=Mycolicibacterium sp. TaxID=2320850 RepID=UPI003D15191A
MIRPSPTDKEITVVSRSDADSWDLSSSVGATATMVAAARAVASRQDDPLIDDPFAAPLVRAVGVEFFTGVVDGTVDLAAVDADGGARMLIDVIAVRTKFFDDFFTAAATAGLRQAVILASGLDSRAFRLDWPAGMVLFEIDQPAVIDFKSEVVAGLGAEPTAERRTVAVDLREDWPAALQAAGFDPTAPTAWSAEGLLVYLPPEAQDRLLDNITALSAPGSRLATEYHLDSGKAMAARSAPMTERWRASGLDLDLSQLWYVAERIPVTENLQTCGWQVSARPRHEVFTAYGRDVPSSEAGELLQNSLAVIAVRE